MSQKWTLIGWLGAVAKAECGFLSLGFAACLAFMASAIDMPQIVSHRGESQDRPENTMASFRLAFARGVDGVECDVYATTDGVPVIIHDSTTGRTAGSGTNLTVTASSWNDLKDVRVGAFGKWIGTEWEGETLPKFEDYLALLASNNTTRCVVELKGNGANNLIANVVAAIQAQTLATKDRVVFISFGTSLISAIRQALPDYEAWLLLGSGTYTGADLISRIQACNATGVDIVHNATYTAEDVAAVKAAGYAFAVWTPNSDADALRYAQMGVDAITTDRGGAMKANLAAALTAWDEIYDPSLPDGVTYLDVGAYVTNGLVAHFDGIRNAGASLPHDYATRTWKNLVPSAPDAVFSGTGGTWNGAGTGFFFDGREAAYINSPGVDLGSMLTIQLVTDVDYTLQHTKDTTGSAGGKGRYPTYFFANSIDLGFYSDNNNSTTSSRINFKHNQNGQWVTASTRPSISVWGGKYVTGIVGNGLSYLIEGTELVNGTACSGNTSIGPVQYSWGGAKSGTDRSIYGTYHAVRLYNRVLSASELKWNRLVDEARFRTPGSNVNVVVESNVAGTEGTEANGLYLVNGHHTFSAAATTVDGNEWEPTGYKLEVWNAERLTWDVEGEHAGTSFAYTNCAARAKVRLTWNWRLVNGVKKYDADSYVQAGLVLNFDGIRNAGLDQPHDPSATKWKNVGSGPSATRTTFDSTRSAGAWAANGYDFNASDCFATDTTVPLVRQATVQVVADYNESVQIHKWPSFFGPSNINGDRFNIYAYTPHNGTGDGNRGDRLQFNTANINNKSVGVQPWDGRFGNEIIDYTRSSHSSAAAYSWNNGSYKSDIGTYAYGIGAAYSSAGNRKDRAYMGVIHAVRLYDRVLTVAEMKYNREVDWCRFYGTAAHSSETDLVEVRSEVPGIDLEDAGGWLVRGTAAKTFTAPATVTVSNCTYACAGYRLETWNATKRMWENPVLMAELCSANVIGTTGQPNLRITWLWTLTAGVRAAADFDVGDYVQQGLVAHYDGIRNRSAVNSHALKGMCWRDISYRDAPMAAASNTAYAAWIEKGHHFTAADESSFRMEEDISLGTECTIQAALDVDCSAQTTSYPLYFGFGNGDFSMFTRGTGTTLEIKTDGWVSSSTARLKLSNWGGKYLTNIITPSDHYLFQGTERVGGAGRARENFTELPSKKMLIGAATTYSGNDRKVRCMTGDYYALRIYNRALTDAEIAQNRKVDEIRYRDNFANYRNLVVVNEQPAGAGETVQGSVADGEYELTGTWTFTAAPVAVGGVKLQPKYKVETLAGGEWVKTAADWGNACTITAGNAPVRLTWQWQRPSGFVLRVQ